MSDIPDVITVRQYRRWGIVEKIQRSITVYNIFVGFLCLLVATGIAIWLINTGFW